MKNEEKKRLERWLIVSLIGIAVSIALMFSVTNTIEVIETSSEIKRAKVEPESELNYDIRDSVRH